MNYETAMKRMIERVHQLGMTNPTILGAMGRVPRHLFPPAPYSSIDNYQDTPCDIGHGQTISQPFIVAHMINCLALTPGAKVLEIGAGCGYQAALLAELGMHVFAVEILPGLATHATEVLRANGYDRVQVSCHDGRQGWPEHAPYDGIIAACAPAETPPGLRAQLAGGGRMILPVGDHEQRLEIHERNGDDFIVSFAGSVRFVPMVGG
ncbi:MAG: protein-L-isoaspartate(D-aspartate) O-methyltransferase [Lentisphaeria bacterium]|jgi:protein-L-isoaspartate(D-aspartate) O-methyltransferase|nr:protein-L-isoaspartate(D-aspartate) O-methyltransferase [Lentisphaeria bacterium]